MKPLSHHELRQALVERQAHDHKGVFGHVLILAGSRNMAGAAILAVRAALRSGAGLVTAAVPVGIQSVVAGQAPEALTLGLPETVSGSLRAEGVGRLRAMHKDARYTVMALGPGLSTNPETAKFVLLVLSSLPLPAVVDADALNVLAAQEPHGVRQLLRSRKQPGVFTPHPGEMARCLRIGRKEVQQDRAGCAQTLAREWNGVALLKGHGTLIADAKRTVINPTGGPGLAKGGTGDVLTGLVAGLWAQLHACGRDDGAFKATALAAWLHGRAGELAQREHTPYAMTAQDVIAHLGAAFKEL